MKASGIIRVVDDLGRVVIPKEIMENLGISPDDPMEIFIHNGAVCFKKYNPNENVESLIDQALQMIKDDDNIEEFTKDIILDKLNISLSVIGSLVNVDKNYIEVDFFGTLEEAVNTLLKYRENGKLARIKFNGVDLYSDNVTMDGAFKDVTGKTKDEFDEDCQLKLDAWNKGKLAHKEKMPTLIEEWKLKGREILDEDKWEFWDKIVPIRLADLYEGMELGACLDVIKILNNRGSMEEAKEKLDSQGHSGMSHSLVCSMIDNLCNNGKKFIEYIDA